MPQLQRRLWNLLRTPLLFYFLGYLPYRFFLSLSLGDDQISGFRRERVWLIFTRPVKICKRPRCFYRIGLLKSQHKLAAYMSALAQLVGLRRIFEWENGVEMWFELTCIGSFAI